MIVISIAHEYIADGWPTFHVVQRIARRYDQRPGHLEYVRHLEDYGRITTTFRVVTT